MSYDDSNAISVYSGNVKKTKLLDRRPCVRGANRNGGIGSGTERVGMRGGNEVQMKRGRTGSAIIFFVMHGLYATS